MGYLSKIAIDVGDSVPELCDYPMGFTALKKAYQTALLGMRKLRHLKNDFGEIKFPGSGSGTYGDKIQKLISRVEISLARGPQRLLGDQRIRRFIITIDEKIISECKSCQLGNQENSMEESIYVTLMECKVAIRHHFCHLESELRLAHVDLRQGDVQEFLETNDLWLTLRALDASMEDRQEIMEKDFSNFNSIKGVPLHEAERKMVADFKRLCDECRNHPLE